MIFIINIDLYEHFYLHIIFGHITQPPKKVSKSTKKKGNKLATLFVNATL